jgi:hypothetical protein
MNIEQLETEIIIGEKASKAWNLWIAGYVTSQQDALFEEFKQAHFQAYNSIQARINAVNELERAIKQDIETGKLAQKQLNIGR